MIKLTLTIHQDADVQTIINALERTQTHLTLEVELKARKLKEHLQTLNEAPSETDDNRSTIRPLTPEPQHLRKKTAEVLPILQSARDDWFNSRMTTAEIVNKYGINLYKFYAYYGNRTNINGANAKTSLRKPTQNTDLTQTPKQAPKAKRAFCK